MPALIPGTLRRYLLGDLPDSEQVALEEELASRPSAPDEVMVAENDLVDAYVGDELSQYERTRFEQRLTDAPRMAERVQIARALRLHAMSVHQTVAPPRSWVSSLAATIRLPY